MLKTRVLTALAMLAALYLGTVYLDPFYFGLVLAAVLLPALLEWAGLMGMSRRAEKAGFVVTFYLILVAVMVALGYKPVAADLSQSMVAAIMLCALLFWIFAFYAIYRFPEEQGMWSGKLRIGLMGLCCMLPTWVGLVQLKYIAPSGYLVLALIALVSIVDIGAFFVGRQWGDSKLAPALSPKKSWAGFWGGLGACSLLTILYLLLLHNLVYALQPGLAVLLLLSALLVAVAGVVGDLYESMLKRHRGVKDSGNSLPGHGGLLDRVDSLLATTPLFVLTLMLLLPNAVWS